LLPLLLLQLYYVYTWAVMCYVLYATCYMLYAICYVYVYAQAIMILIDTQTAE